MHWYVGQLSTGKWFVILEKGRWYRGQWVDVVLDGPFNSQEEGLRLLMALPGITIDVIDVILEQGEKK